MNYFHELVAVRDRGWRTKCRESNCI